MADGKAHLGLEGVEVELDEIGKTPLEHEVGDTAGELHRLVGVAAEADGQLAGAAVDGHPTLLVPQHIGKLVTEPPVPYAEIILEGKRPRPGRHFAERITEDRA